MTSTHKTELTAKIDQFERGLLGAVKIRGVEVSPEKLHEMGVFAVRDCVQLS